ncbi:MAG: hypothetical protein JW820_16010 [Spirochaetales bacterium]|nr:hypothetical protein [Spirochaetales bacterium]
MPTTTVHLPGELLQKMDAAARRRGISRNRFVVEACEEAVAADAGQWPEDLFELGLSGEDQALLEQASAELERAVLENRRNRGASLL